MYRNKASWLIAASTLSITPNLQAADLLSAVESAAGICEKSITSESLVRNAIDRAESKAALNAIITLDEQGAMAAAKAIDGADETTRCKPLAGIPIVVKDNTHVANLPNTAEAGAIILAKTTMHELAFGISGYNPVFQTGEQTGVRNAYNSEFAAGGSSSGTGAALGARIVSAGLGTDTGGSVRVPCAFNGCAALRPSIARYSNEGITPISHTRDTPGPMALTMADIELLDRVITGSPPAKPANLDKIAICRRRDC